MPVFSPVGWMIKGGGAGASETGWSDADPYEGKTIVGISFNSLSFNKSSYQLAYNIKQSGFSTTKANIYIELNLNKDGENVGWHYYNLNTSIDLLPNVNKSYNLSKAITKNKTLVSELKASGQKTYLLIMSGNQIAEQISV